MREFLSDRSIHAPVAGLVDLDSGLNGEVLNVSPSQIAIRLQCQSIYAGNQRSSCTCTAMVGVALCPADIRGMDGIVGTRRVGDDQLCGALLGVIRM